MKRLVGLLDLQPDSLVLDISAGKAIITNELIKRSNRVLAVEPDFDLCNDLKRKFRDDSRVTIIGGDLLSFKFPEENFKTFSNFPVLLSNEMTNRLLSNKYFTNGFLVLQRDIALMNGGEQLNHPNSFRSVLFNANFEIKVVFTINRVEFRSLQRSDFLLIRFVRREDPLIPLDQQELFTDFISYCFNNSRSHIGTLSEIFSAKQFARFYEDIGLHFKTAPSAVTFEQYKYLFDFLNENAQEKIELIKGQYKKSKQLNSMLVRV